MTDASVNDPCECGQTTIRGCADMPSRHCGAWEETAPPAFTAHELSALAEQGMTLTEAEEATVRQAQGLIATNIDALMAEMRAGFEKVNHGPHQLDITNEDRCSGLIDHIWRCSPANIRTLLDEIERLRAELAGQRMCVNCGKYAPDGHDRTQPLPECVGPEGLAACTFNSTPHEAWQHWSKIAHDLRADNARLRANIEELKA